MLAKLDRFRSCLGVKSFNAMALEHGSEHLPDLGHLLQQEL